MSLTCLTRIFPSSDFCQVKNFSKVYPSHGVIALKADDVSVINHQAENQQSLQLLWEGFILVALRIVNTIPLPKIAGVPPQDLNP